MDEYEEDRHQGMRESDVCLPCRRTRGRSRHTRVLKSLGPMANDLRCVTDKRVCWASRLDSSGVVLRGVATSKLRNEAAEVQPPDPAEDTTLTKPRRL